MGKKHKHPEHVNLERYLISYADFITLLFATFVVLYALSQVDIKDFKSLQNSIKQAFAAPSIIQGSNGLMQDSSDSIFDASQGDSMITPLMMEYMSQKYEEQSMQEIAKEVENEEKAGKINGVEAIETDKGLIIRFSGDFLFQEGSAELSSAAKTKLDKIGVIIIKKFVLHNMRVEGHTDNQAMKSALYPSNWELSSARASSIVRYFISRFNLLPSLFTVVGFADTRPIVDNATSTGRAKNRRVDILILKNRFNSSENPQNAVLKMSQDAQEKLQADRINAINRIEAISDSVSKNISSNPDKREAILLNQIYDKETTRLSKETQAWDNANKDLTGDSWLKPPATVNQIKVFK